jgi:hypothetical protein
LERIEPAEGGRWIRGCEADGVAFAEVAAVQGVRPIKMVHSFSAPISIFLFLLSCCTMTPLVRFSSFSQICKSIVYHYIKKVEVLIKIQEWPLPAIWFFQLHEE